MLLSYNGLVDLVEKGYLKHVLPENIGAASIDVTLAPTLFQEIMPESFCPNCSRKVEPDAILPISPKVSERVQCPHCKQMAWTEQYQAPIDIREKEQMRFKGIDCTATMGGHVLWPGQCVLASTNEVFNLPNHIATEYKLKSSMARVFLGHLLAGWADPGFHGSNLTLELKNESQFHKLKLVAGMKIGQIVCWECEEVPNEKSYAQTGRYNKSEGVVQGQGVI